MYLDAQNLYSDKQSVAATAVSTNIIDHGADRNLGIGEPLALVIVVTTVLDAGNADETYSAQLQTDDNAAFSSATSVGGAVSLPRGSAAGTKFVFVLPSDTSIERFTRVNYTVGGITPSGNVTAFLTALSMVHNDVHYADAITISG
jgi:hypothetical protein